MNNNNNDNMNMLIQEAEFRLQTLYESLDDMILNWENRFNVYIEMLEEKKNGQYLKGGK